MFSIFKIYVETQIANFHHLRTFADPKKSFSCDNEDLSNIHGFHLTCLLWLIGGVVLHWMSQPFLQCYPFKHNI